MSTEAVLIVVALAVALRILPTAKWPQLGADAGYHLLLRREVRRRHRLPPHALALDERQTYPVLYHVLLAALPLRLLLRAPAVPSTILDVLLSIVAGLLATELAVGIGVDPGNAALLAAILVVASPALLAPGIGPRAYEITPRPLGELFFAAGTAAAGMYHVTSRPVWAVASASAFSLALLGSKFTAQVVAFCVPLLAMSVGDWRVAAIAVSAVPLALAISGGSYWWVLRGQLAHLKLYRDRLQEHHPALQARRRNELLAAVRAAVGARLQDRMANRRAAMAFDASAVTQFLLRHGIQSVAPILGLLPALHGILLTDSPLVVWLYAWLAVPVVPFLIASHRRYLFLGEAERYLEYAVVPAAVLSSVLVLHWPPGLRTLLVSGWLGAAGLAVGYHYVRARMLGKRQGLAALLAHLETHEAGRRVLPIPAINVAFELAWRCEHRFLVAMDSFVWARSYDRLFAEYPWPSVDLEWWRTVHGAELVVVAKGWLERDRGCVWQDPLSTLVNSFDHDGYAVYTFPPEAPGASAVGAGGQIHRTDPEREC